MIESVIRPKEPARGSGWVRLPRSVTPLLQHVPHSTWAHYGAGLGVISAVEVASEARGMAPLGPAYHLSVSRFGARCTSADAVWVLAQFDLTDALEDNHVPSGKVRNFWRYVADDLAGMKCACVATEPAIREDKGDYVWRGS